MHSMPRSSLRRRLGSLAMSAAAISLLAACASSPQTAATAPTTATPAAPAAAPETSGIQVMTPGGATTMTETGAGPSGQLAQALETAPPPDSDPTAAAAYWAMRVQTDSRDWQAAINFSRALRNLGSGEAAVKAMAASMSNFPDEPAVMAEYGKALVTAERAADALPFLSRASQLSAHDWTILTAEGVALDQLGRHKEAQTRYEAALKVSPDNISILNNLGLSRALGGDLPGAEQSLRQAAAAPSAPAKVRQNLALVVGIKGDYSEAQKLVRADFPERVAANNLAFYQQFHPRDIRPAAE